MDRFIASIQLVAAAVLGIATIATVVNVVLITANQENSISVVNTIIGQGVLIIFLGAMTRILWRKGRAGWRAAGGDAATKPENNDDPAP